MFVALLGFTALISVTSATTLKDANSYDRHLKFTCPNNQIINRVHSEHHNGYEDRQWAFTCSYAPSGATLSGCAWSGYVSEMTEASLYQCHGGGVIAGWESYHKGKGTEDRRTKYRCCQAVDYLTHSCRYTGFLNGFDEVLNYRVPEGWAITGVFSYYSKSDWDRRFNFNICALDLAA